MIFGMRNQLGPAFRETNELLFDTSSGLTYNELHHKQMSLTYVGEVAALLKTFANDQGITPLIAANRLDEYYELLAFN